MSKTENDFSAYEKMWNEEKDFYVLSEVGSEGSFASRYTITDLRTNQVILIESSELASGIIRNMLSAGVSVGDSTDLTLRKNLIRARLKKSGPP